MMNKKAKKSDDQKKSDGSTVRTSFTPFTNLRKSFKRLKHRKEKRCLSVDSMLDKENVKNCSSQNQSDNIEKTKVVTSKNENSQNILKRLASGKRFRRKNVQSVPCIEDICKFNVIEWSSCESLSDNFEKRMRKHNSLRRSKASLLMPVSGKDSKKLSPPSTKITRYSSMNAINDDDKENIKGSSKWFSSQNVAILNSKDKVDAKDLKETSENDCVCEKRKRPINKANKKHHTLSLPNICEDTLKEKSVEIEIDISFEEPKDENKNTVQIEDNSDHKKCTEEHIYSKNRLHKKRCSLILLENNKNDILYGSSPFLNRPPIPSAPKPITRRDRILRKSVSTEALTPKKRRAESSIKLHKRALSESTFHGIKSENKEDIVIDISVFDDHLQQKEQKDNLVVQEISKSKSNNCLSAPGRSHFSPFSSVNDLPSFMIQNENVWKRSMASYHLPLAIAEALWDHTSLNNDELTFSSGDVIAVLFTEDESWWWGAQDDEEGWFPASYVRLRVVQEIDDELNCPTNQEEHVSAVNSQSSQTVARKTSTLSVMGIQARAKNMEQLMTVRAKCVEELLNTERDYVKMLKNIIEGYLNKVRQEKSLFTPADADTIFGNIEELYKFHREFLKELQENIKFGHMEESVVGHLFLKHKNKFEVYSKYCNNQPRSSARISTLTKDKKYELFFETCRLRQNMIRLSLDGFLLSPVQRICKYPLQLKELLKHTCNEHDDYSTLNEARVCMQNVASLINERKRRLENVNKLARWQLTVSNWKGEDVVLKSSDLLLKGLLNKITNGRDSERYCYLFDHQLLYFLKDPNNKRQPFMFRGRIDLDTAIIENLDDNHVFVRGDTIPNVWRIWNKDKSKWCYFYADSCEKKEMWIKSFENEREHVKEEQAKGFTVLAEVRIAAMESAYTKHIAGIKRGRMRRKSICTNHPELETTFGSSLGSIGPPTPPNRQLSAGSSDEGPTVRKRTHKPRRNRSFRWSLNGSIFDKTIFKSSIT